MLIALSPERRQTDVLAALALEMHRVRLPLARPSGSHARTLISMPNIILPAAVVVSNL